MPATTGAAAGRTPDASAVFTKARTSSGRIRPFGPEPLTWLRSTPSSRAKRRTEGEACARGDVAWASCSASGRVPISTANAVEGGDPPGAATGALAAGATGAEGATAGADAGAATGGAVAADEGAGAAAAAALAEAAASLLGSSSRISVPCDTLSPSFTFSSRTTPAIGDGISIEALSDSTVISDCSGLTRSPGATSSSMTSTSLKSPMSGTLISTMLPMGFPRVLLRPSPLAPLPLRGRGALSTIRLPLSGKHSHQPRVGPLRIDPVPLDRLGHLPDRDRALFRERLQRGQDRKSTRLNSSHLVISYAVFCLKKKKKKRRRQKTTIKKGINKKNN